MTIDLKSFDKGLSLLEQNYERKLPDAIKAIWFEYLDKHLNNAEFAAAVKHVILHSRFMPTASELVEHVHGTKQAQAVKEWQFVLKAASGRNEVLTYLSNRARVALQAIGGIHAVAMADEYGRNRLEKSFSTVYCQCSDKDARMLSQHSCSAPQDGAEDTNDLSPMPEHIKAQMEALSRKMGMNNRN